MEVSDARKPKSLEKEKARLKNLLTESMLDVSTLGEMLAKNFSRPARGASRDLGDLGKGLFAAARLPARWHGAEDVPLCLAAC